MGRPGQDDGGGCCRVRYVVARTHEKISFLFCRTKGTAAIRSTISGRYVWNTSHTNGLRAKALPGISTSGTVRLSQKAADFCTPRTGAASAPSRQKTDGSISDRTRQRAHTGKSCLTSCINSISAARATRRRILPPNTSPTLTIIIGKTFCAQWQRRI